MKIHTKICLIVDLITEDRHDLNGRLGAIGRSMKKVDPGANTEFVGYVREERITQQELNQHEYRVVEVQGWAGND